MYRIEIWQHHVLTATYESDNISDILQWYKVNWWWVYELGDCVFYVYKCDVELSFDEELKLGFFD